MLTGLVSSPGRLARFFRRSRDSWKERSLKYQQRIKALDGRVSDLERSREKWKAQAKEARRELGTLRQEHADALAKADGPAEEQAAVVGSARIVAPSTGIVPVTATAAPPFCLRSSTVTR